MKGDHGVINGAAGTTKQILKHGGFCLAVTGTLAFHRYTRDLGPFKSGSLRPLTLYSK